MDKIVIGRKDITLNAYIRKEDLKSVTKVSCVPKKLEKEEKHLKHI